MIVATRANPYVNGHRQSAAVAVEEPSDEAVPGLFPHMPVARAGYDRILRCSIDDGRYVDLAVMVFDSFNKVFLVGAFPKLVLHRDAKIGAEATLEEKVELRQLSDEELSFFEGSLPDVLQGACGLLEPPTVTHHPRYSHAGHTNRKYTSITNPENVNGSNARWSRSYMQRLPLPSETFRS